MAYSPKILAFAGSTREGSFNKQLVKIAAQGARAAGAQVTVLDLRDLPMPLYDGDLEAGQGLPENAGKFRKLMLEHDGLLISAPEYNSSISGVLKNTIDWASRPVAGEPPLACFAGKVAGLMSASPGALGGLRGLVTVRSVLSNIRVIVLPDQVAVPKAHEAFGPDGKLKDTQQHSAVENLGRNLTAVLGKLKG
ncbi:MAG: NAD(P)H-dependent oxidoreductase [Candidatus Omnitrophica bacterium]|nr:NAD(P)H-dependent oxidoreductase [Candidatus Omnitrophota bacterium]MDE2009208.1 NAD(P)H-dependent oxidoreductase [Candidatus Omnitrophota bacterium]MDE2213729.1 NAD(P)H-dependent oxidoreductase [Candidatus Omnitrophota bacterium]MDE2230696.1 NAD(P)H-dependent oxidoreductase [Candidatus Omnitrophota bacterium]